MTPLWRILLDISRQQRRMGHFAVAWHLLEWLLLSVMPFTYLRLLNLAVSAALATWLYRKARDDHAEALRLRHTGE